MITITRAKIDELRTVNGGFTRSTTEALDICWPLQAGWMEKLVGVSVSNKAWNEALKGRERGMNHRFRGNTRSYA